MSPTGIARCDPLLRQEVEEIQRQIARYSRDPAQLKNYLRGLQLKWHPDKASEPAALRAEVFRIVQHHWEKFFKH